MIAPARLTASGAQMPALRDMFIPTFTKTQPCNVAALDAMLAQYGKPAKNLSGEIDSFSHKAVWHSAMDFAIDKAEE